MKATNKNLNMNRGAAILALLFVFLFLLVFIRFLYIQATGTVHGEVLAARAEVLYESKRPIEATRGSILDTNGKVIAEDKATYKLIAILDDQLTTNPDTPQHVVDIQKTAQQLAPLLNLEISDVVKILSKKNVYQVEFGSAGRNITHSLKEKIEDLQLPGVTFIRDTQRFYPNGLFASHLIGYAQKDEETNETKGMMGLEKTLDKYLHEEDGYVKYQQDGYSWRLPNSKDEIIAPKNGNNVHLTIDQKIQTFLEDSMNQVVTKYSPEKIIAVVADPKTGKILAMGQRPSFDPNKRDITSYYNDVVSYPFEPGSTMKIFTLAAAINEGVYNGEAIFQSGTYAVDGPDIKDHNHGNGWGPITYNEGVQRSSNVGFSIIADQLLGTDRLYQYLNKFGFVAKTGIDLPDEASSKINFDIHRDKVSTAFGQASAVTPIQQIQAATAIANGGKMMKPYVIEKITNADTNKVVKETEPTIVSEPITEATANSVLSILDSVVSSEKGTGKPFRIEGYNIAGKTGTAQISTSSGYLSGNDNHIFSFLGMAPTENPELIVYVAVQQPKLKGEAGSTPVSMIFNTVMENSLKYMQIAPTNEGGISKQVETSEMNLPSLAGLTTEEAVKQLEELSLEPIIIGTGKQIIAHYPKASTEMILNEKVLLKTTEEALMPDLSGWSKRDLMKLGNLLEITIQTEGSGYVVKQGIKKGSTVKKGDVLQVTLKSDTNQKEQSTDNDKSDKNEG
ncbi:penicillin-binding protein [Metabacillus malikii]|uniref:serine-type D-Ala-D-Ala carboxypeptidase n=1 Tax=Metabacillus malikii TaxID=1504265 RepID=A0ABT9ZHJ4_9BACI|nr:penicillin-binding protein [Metabacillus malikii]MDQ0231276.1 penicillin-binding protein 2B [Metabacillus malikii]